MKNVFLWSCSVCLGSPGVGAVPVQRLEVGPGDELATVDSGLDGSEPPQDAHLLHGAHHRADVQPLQLGIDGVQSAHQVLQEELEHLRQADQLHAVDRERSHFHAVNFHHLTLGVRRSGAASAARPVNTGRDSAAPAAQERSGKASTGEPRGAGRFWSVVGRIGVEEGVGGRGGCPGQGGARHVRTESTEEQK